MIEAIGTGKVPYHTPVFRALAIAAAPPGEREKFLDQIADQIDSIAIDVSTMGDTLNFVELDEISTIKESVDTIEKSQSAMERVLDDLKADVEKILDKME